MESTAMNQFESGFDHEAKEYHFERLEYIDHCCLHHGTFMVNCSRFFKGNNDAV